jgi:GNAT superfamily N-acetyltransferase
MQIRRVGIHDEAESVRFHQIVHAAETFERPFSTSWSLRELQVLLRSESKAERWEAWGAFEGDEMVGAGVALLPVVDNRHLAYLIPNVEPERRRAGIGGALLEEMADAVTAEGRRDLVMESAYPFERREDHPYRRFAEKHGFRIANTEIRRILDLPVPTSDLDKLIDEAAPHHPGYRIETYLDGVPEELQPSLCHVWNQLGLDAPTGEFEYEEEARTPELYREEVEIMRGQGRTYLQTLAIGPDGDVVAYNDLVLRSDDPDNVSQWGTLVRRDHRGHRLGMAVKARGLKELAARAPEAVRVQTCNAEQNQHMVAINERLGFRAVEVTPGFLRRLSS